MEFGRNELSIILRSLNTRIAELSRVEHHFDVNTAERDHNNFEEAKHELEQTEKLRDFIKKENKLLW